MDLCQRTNCREDKEENKKKKKAKLNISEYSLILFIVCN